MANNRGCRMYSDLAWAWPIISPPEDYADEAAQFITAISKHSLIPVQTVLDLGCGGGHNDFHLKRDFSVTGVDLSTAMLSNARKLNPEVEYLEGDMRDLGLGKRFDAVMIADAIMYMLSEVELLAAFRTAFMHLKPGGVFCTYVEETPDKLTQNRTHVSFRSEGDVDIALVENVHDPDPGDTTYSANFMYIIRTGGSTEIEVDTHTFGLFPLATWKKLLKESGFRPHGMMFRDHDDYPFFACVKPLNP